MIVFEIISNVVFFIANYLVMNRIITHLMNIDLKEDTIGNEVLKFSAMIVSIFYTIIIMKQFI